ncbi:gypsy type transposase [Tanacetum coccineum]
MTGNFFELGPYLVTSSLKHNVEHLTLKKNLSSWNRLFGLLFLDNPIGTGFNIASTYEEIPRLATLYDFRRLTHYETTKVTSFLSNNEIKKILKANEYIVYEACSQVVGFALHEDLMQSVRVSKREVWEVNGQLAGYVQKYGNLMNVVVFGAGHLVPADLGRSGTLVGQGPLSSCLRAQTPFRGCQLSHGWRAEVACGLSASTLIYPGRANVVLGLFPAMDLIAFNRVTDPTKVRIVERECAEGEVKLLDSTVGRIVLLLPIAPARAESDLEASMNKIFDEGGGADQGDSATGGGNDVEIELVTTFEDTAVVTAERPKRHRKKRPAVADVSGSYHPPKKLRGVTCGDLPFVTSSVSATPEREDDNPTDSVTRANLRVISPAERFVIFQDSSHHSSAHASRAEVASVIRSAIPPTVITEAVITVVTIGIPSAPIPETSAKVNPPVHASMFHDSDYVGMVKPDVAGPSHLPGKELSLRSREVDSEHLHEVFISRWNIANDALLNDLDTSREFVDHLAPPVLFSQIRDMDYEQLFTEFNVGTARQVCLNVEVRMRTEYCLSETKKLELECVNQANLLKAKNDDVERLKAQLLLKEDEAAETIHLHSQVSTAEATEKIHADEIKTLKQRNVSLETEKNFLDGKVTELQSSVSTKDLELKDANAALSSLRSQNDGLVDQVHALETSCSGLRERLSGYENLTEQLEKFQDAQLKAVNDKVAKLDADLAEMACHLEEKFYPYLLTTISSLGAVVKHASERGMQDGLAAGIDHGKEGRSLTDVAAYNPSMEANFNFALQEL